MTKQGGDNWRKNKNERVVLKLMSPKSHQQNACNRTPVQEIKNAKS